MLYVHKICSGPASPLVWPQVLQYEYRPDQTHPSVGIGQTIGTQMWVLARTNRPKCRYWLDRTDQKLPLATRNVWPNFSQTNELFHTGPPCLQPESVSVTIFVYNLGTRKNYVQGRLFKATLQKCMHWLESTINLSIGSVWLNNTPVNACSFLTFFVIFKGNAKLRWSLYETGELVEI